MKSSVSSRSHLIFILSLLILCSHINIWAGVGASFDFISDSGVKKNLGGYIKAEYYYDSRQVVGISVDQFLFFPQPQVLDPCCNDLNRRGEGHFVAVESRLSFSFQGTKVKSADLSGIIEADFWVALANTLLQIPDIFRLRHAALFLNWPCIELTMGQYWHPITISECYPNTVSFNDGLPIDLATRTPLIKLDVRKDTFHIISCASYDLDFRNFGPEGYSPVYMARGMVPNFHVQFKKFFDAHVIGAGLNYTRMVPRINTPQGYSVVEPLSSFIGFAWLALNWPEKFAWHQKVAFAQNATDYNSLGAYATTHIDHCTGKKKYTNFNTIAYWWDFIVHPGQTVEPGLFMGAIKNLGALEPIIPDTFNDEGILVDQNVFGLGANITYLTRVSPRIRWRLSKEFMIAAEFEWTRAAFGTVKSSGKIVDGVPVNNLRGLCAAYYLF